MERLDKAFLDTVGHGDQANPMNLLQVLQFFHVLLGKFATQLNERRFPLDGGLASAGTGQHFMSQHQRAKLPGVSLIGRLETEKIEQGMEIVAVVRLCGGCVVVLVLLVVFDDRLQDDLQAGDRLITAHSAVEIVDEFNGVQRVGALSEQVQVRSNASVENGPQVGEGQKPGM